MAGCKNDQTGEEFRIEPTYPKGKPKELEGLSFTKISLILFPNSCSTKDEGSNRGKKRVQNVTAGSHGAEPPRAVGRASCCGE